MALRLAWGVLSQFHPSRPSQTALLSAPLSLPVVRVHVPSKKHKRGAKVPGRGWDRSSNLVRRGPAPAPQNTAPASTCQPWPPAVSSPLGLKPVCTCPVCRLLSCLAPWGAEAPSWPWPDRALILTVILGASGLDWLRCGPCSLQALPLPLGPWSVLFLGPPSWSQINRVGPECSPRIP